MNKLLGNADFAVGMTIHRGRAGEMLPENMNPRDLECLVSAGLVVDCTAAESEAIDAVRSLASEARCAAVAYLSLGLSPAERAAVEMVANMSETQRQTVLGKV